MAVDHLGVLASESERFIDVVRHGDREASVPGCPEWSLHDLAVHQGGVWRWATSILQTGEPGGADPEPTPDDVVSWLDASIADLHAAIDASDPDAPCWNLWNTAEKTVRFWHRRMACETAMHRWDAESAVGEAAPFAPEVAADIVDEWVHVILPRHVDRGSVDLAAITGDLHVHCTDTPGEWTLDVVDGALAAVNEHRKSAVAARGAASDLALLVYNRGDRSGVEVFGDQDLLDRWIS